MPPGCVLRHVLTAVVGHGPILARPWQVGRAIFSRSTERLPPPGYRQAITQEG